jgi:hypothetical protein
MAVSFLVFCVAVLIVCALLVYAVRVVPAIPAPFNQILQVLILVIGALVIAERAGLFAA